MNFYKHHLGDYDGATSHLSWDEDMAYTRLLRIYYRREQAIPDAERYRLCRATSKALRAAVDAVLGEFFKMIDGAWHNKRAEEEIAAYQLQAETNRRIATNRQRTVHEPSTKGLPNQNHHQNPEPEPESRKEHQHQFCGNSKNAASKSNGVVVVIPLLDKKEWPVPAEFVLEMEAAYPAVDGPGTLREIRAWCIANPERCRLECDVRKFVNSWFERTQNA